MTTEGKRTAWAHHLCEAMVGSFAGCAPLVVGQPLDTVRIRQQTYTQGIGMWQCAKGIMKNEGWTSLFKGMPSIVLGQFPIQFMVFMGNSMGEYMTKNWNLSKGMKEYLNGTFGGAVALSVVTPIELIKCRRQVNKERVDLKDRAVVKMIKEIYKEEGVRGFTRGMSVLGLRDVPTYGLWFLAYNRVCYWLATSEEEFLSNSVAVWKVAIAGAAAGVTAWTASYPFELLKTHVQTTDMNARQVARKLWRQDGITAFTRGYMACVIRAIPVNALTFILYDKLKWLCNNY